MVSFKTIVKKFKANNNVSEASSVNSTDNPKPSPKPVSVEIATETGSTLRKETIDQESEPHIALQQSMRTTNSNSRTEDNKNNDLEEIRETMKENDSAPPSSVDKGDQDTPAQDPPQEGNGTAFVDVTPTSNLTETPLMGTPVPVEQVIPWDEAYNSLTLEAPELVAEYENTLLLISGTHAPNGQVNAVQHFEKEMRWQEMCRLLTKWLQNRNSDGTGRMQNLLRDHVEKSTGGSPSSALAWTSLCYASSVLLVPQPETRSICLDFTRIICKMNWYASLSKLLLPEYEGRDEGDSLRNNIVDLYKAILSYGMNALLLSSHLPQNRHLSTWEESLVRLKVAEENLSLFGGGIFKKHLDDIKVFDGKEGKRQDPIIENYPRVAERFLKQLKRLGYVDPKMGLQESRVEKRFSINELLQWICSNTQYRNVVDWDGGMSTVLLISGPPGIGKTTLMEAIVRHLLDEAASMESCSSETELDQDRNRSDDPALSDVGSSDNDSNANDSDTSDSASSDVNSSDSDSRSSISTDLGKEISTMSREMPWALAYYFCGRTGHGLDNSARVLRSLIYSLLQQQPRLISHLKEMKHSTGRDRLDNSNDFIALSGIFFQMLKDDQFMQTYFVLDGIDEHSSNDDGVGLNDLLQLIRTAVIIQPKARWLVSADTKVRAECELAKVKGFEHILLGNNSQDAPAGTFDGSIRNIISDLFEQRCYDATLRDTMEQLIREKAGENTIWSIVACATLRNEENWYAPEILREMPQNLDDLYQYARDGIEKLPRRDPEYCKTVLSTMAIALRPLSVQELAKLADLPPLVEIVAIVDKCGSFLEVRDGIVKFVNPSARHNLRKHLFEASKSGMSRAHSLMTRKALASLTAYFKQGQPNPEELTERYETLHWLMHLLNVDDIANDDDTANLVIRFLEDYFLSWLDVMMQDSLHIDAGTLMRRLENLLLDQSNHQKDQTLLLRIVQDAGRVITSHKTIQSVFHSNPRTVIFYPDDSALKQRWLAKHKAWLITAPITAKRWDDNLPILTGHSDWVREIAFSPGGRLLASGSDDTTVRIWDVETGAAQLTLQDHHDWVRSVAFSVSGQLATGSDDRVIHIWDPITGNRLQTLPDQDGSVMAIRFSPDGSTLAVATTNRLSLWDISDLANPVKIELEGLEGEFVVRSIDYSQTGQWIASTWEDSNLQIWRTTVNQLDNKLAKTLRGHSSTINSVAFSPDERYVASGSEDGAIKIWDLESGTVFYTFDCKACVLSVAFSPLPQKLSMTAGPGNRTVPDPEKLYVAAGSENRTIETWDLSTKELISVKKGHGRYVRTVAFLRDNFMASGSDDMTIRLWRLSGDTAKSEDYEEDSIQRGSVNLLAISPHGLYMASVSGSSVYLWDGTTGLPMKHHILSGHDSSILSIVFSPEGERLASTSSDASVRLWDVTSGGLIKAFEGHADWVRCAAFSPDGRYIAAASDDSTVSIWDTEEKEEKQTPKLLEEYEDYVRAVAFSPDGKLLASGGDDRTVLIWDFPSLVLRFKLNTDSNVISLLFSQDSSRVMSRSHDAHVRVWDVSTGEPIGSPIRTRAVRRYALFDPRIPDYMLTEFGVDLSDLDASSLFGERSTQESLYGISAFGDSITRNGREVIPIPERYEPTASWVQGQTVAFGTKFGEVLLFRFSTADEPS